MMSVEPTQINKPQSARVNIPVDDSRLLWIAILHAVVMIKVAIVKFLRIEDRCEHCGNKL